LKQAKRPTELLFAKTVSDALAAAAPEAETPNISAHTATIAIAARSLWPMFRSCGIKVS
jgi:hypothetical protein